jgi:hypothetical protein
MIINSRSEYTAACARRDIDPVDKLVLKILGDDIMKREEIYSQLGTRYGFSKELCVDLVTDVICDMTDDGILERVKKGYYRVAV